jgi:hypothetical protein
MGNELRRTINLQGAYFAFSIFQTNFSINYAK